MATVTVTTIVENAAGRADLQAEHGLAVWIDTGRHRVLFDTGQGDLVLANARALDIGLEQADAIVLSHGHYDHTGGLAGVLSLARGARVFLHPAALAGKYARDPNGRCRAIGMPRACQVALSQHPVRSATTERVTEVVEGVFVTGAVPRTNDFEDTGGPFFLDEACTQPDPLIDDQSLFFDSPQGLIVLLGCAHAGIINMLEYIHRTTGRPIHTVLGGTHLGSASEHRLGQTIEALRRLDVKRLGPAHCTGTAATACLQQALPGCCFACPGGTQLRINGPAANGWRPA
jgi:7,8-dihydropterin-6-yl-methyl-4-(beta-D-ribofuranosyl)aminobenzene 5'-phosphate synthase